MAPPPDIDPSLRTVLPLTAAVSAAGRLEIGGCDAVELAREFGTPLYLFDEADLRDRCQEFLREFRNRLPDARVVYAAKAYIGRALARLVAEEGLGLDVVSGGELAIARAAGFPLDRVYLHGNNKSRQEVREAVGAGVGHVVIDNLLDIESTGEAAAAAGRRQAVMLRITPDVDPHTHSHITTGVLDSKFGFPLAEGMAEAAVERIQARPELDLDGVHCHIGSQVFETEPYTLAVERAVEFAAAMVQRHGLNFRELSPGGGIGVQYARGETPPPVAAYARAVADALDSACKKHGLPVPNVAVEPGRAIVARAGVALYTVGSRKSVPGVRTFVAVDGGMADNIRPAIYGSLYEAVAAGKPTAPADETVTIVGKYCESGDILIRDVALPRLDEGDILAVPASGAYCLPMASNYNSALRPAIVFVRDGKARLVRRRETYEDLLACEVD